MKPIIIGAAALLLAGVTTACMSEQSPEDKQTNAWSASTTAIHAKSTLTAVANVVDSKGKSVGQAQLMQTAEGVKINFEGKGLRPGLHAFHIHEKGVCVAPDFKSAGEHFNPGGKKHGFDNPAGFHAGDLENIRVAQDGTVKAEWMAPLVTLEKGMPNSLFKTGGTAVVIHDMPDDYYTDPTGRAGDRVACGVIRSS